MSFKFGDEIKESIVPNVDAAEVIVYPDPVNHKWVGCEEGKPPWCEKNSMVIDPAGWQFHQPHPSKKFDGAGGMSAIIYSSLFPDQLYQGRNFILHKGLKRKFMFLCDSVCSEILTFLNLKDTYLVISPTFLAVVDNLKKLKILKDGKTTVDNIRGMLRKYVSLRDILSGMTDEITAEAVAAAAQDKLHADPAWQKVLDLSKVQARAADIKAEFEKLKTWESSGGVITTFTKPDDTPVKFYRNHWEQDPTTNPICVIHRIGPDFRNVEEKDVSEKYGELLASYMHIKRAVCQRFLSRDILTLLASTVRYYNKQNDDDEIGVPYPLELSMLIGSLVQGNNPTTISKTFKVVDRDRNTVTHSFEIKANDGKGNVVIHYVIGSQALGFYIFLGKNMLKDVRKKYSKAAMAAHLQRIKLRKRWRKEGKPEEYLPKKLPKQLPKDGGRMTTTIGLQINAKNVEYGPPVNITLCKEPADKDTSGPIGIREIDKKVKKEVPLVASDLKRYSRLKTHFKLICPLISAGIFRGEQGRGNIAKFSKFMDSQISDFSEILYEGGVQAGGSSTGVESVPEASAPASESEAEAEAEAEPEASATASESESAVEPSPEPEAVGKVEICLINRTQDNITITELTRENLPVHVTQEQLSKYNTGIDFLLGINEQGDGDDLVQTCYNPIDSLSGFPNIFPSAPEIMAGPTEIMAEVAETQYTRVEGGYSSKKKYIKRTKRLSKKVKRFIKNKRKISKRKISKRKISKRKISKRKISKRKISKRKISKRKISKRKISKK
jgi:hypothetical protein